VVQGCSTRSLKDSTSIQLELTLVCLNGYRDWLVGHCLQCKRGAISSKMPKSMQQI